MDELVQYHDIWIRTGDDGRLDKFAYKDHWPAMQKQIREGDVVMDLGGYIGITARRAAERGAHVISYEPYEGHVAVHQANTRHLGVEIVRCAVAKEAGFKTFYLSKRSGMSHSLVYRKRAQTTITVPVRSFTDEVARHEPTVIKMDIEGAEYELIDELLNLPDHVRVLAMEFQLIKQPGRLQIANNFFFDLIAKDKWKYVYGPKTSGAWQDVIEMVAVRT